MEAPVSGKGGDTDTRARRSPGSEKLIRPGGDGRSAGWRDYGIDSPERDRTTAASPLLIVPSALKSERKFAALTGWPERDRVCCASPEFTFRSAVVSPRRNPTVTSVWSMFWLSVSLTSLNAMVRRCAFATPVKLTK